MDLFDPDDGTYEYSAVATNLPLKLRALWRFAAGRGVHEKAMGELKSALSFDTMRPEGRLTLRLQPNKRTEKQYRNICTILRNAA